MPRTDEAWTVVSAPAERVYAALVNRDELVAWLPPQGMTGRFEHFDARPGGSFRLVLTYDDPTGAPGKSSADTDVVESRFVDLVDGEQVVMAVDFASDDPAFAGTMTMTWDLSEISTGTLVSITAADVPDGITADDHAEGMTSTLVNLRAHLER